MGASDETTNFLPLSLDPSSPLCSGRVVSHHLCGHLASTGGSVWKRSDMPRRPALPRLGLLLSGHVPRVPRLPRPALLPSTTERPSPPLGPPH